MLSSLQISVSSSKSSVSAVFYLKTADKQTMHLRCFISFISYQSWSAMMFFNVSFYQTVWSTLKTRQIHEKRLIYLWSISICNLNNCSEHARILFSMSTNFLKSLHLLMSTMSCLLHCFRIILIINQILSTRTRYLLMIFTFLHMNYQKNLCVIQIQTRNQALIVQIILQMMHIN